MIIWCVLRPLLDVRVEGRDRIPQDSGALLLANHTTFLDFLLCLWGVYRPVHALGSEQVFRLPVAGWILTQLNGAPISKGAKDGAAVRHLVHAYEAGRLSGMFPEGKRSWTGRPLPITYGTGRLVKSLGCPVIYCRVTTGFMQHPRWAKWPRRVPWRMEYSAPERFPEDATIEEINAAIARGLHVDPDQVELPAGSWGFRLAEGLPEFLWACPGCFALESLRIPDDRDCVDCGACGRRWRLDLACKMLPETPDAEALTVAIARDRLSERFDGALELECADARVSKIYRGVAEPELLASGLLRLGDDGLVLLGDDGQALWSLPYAQMKAVLLQFRNALHVRVEGANFQLDPGEESRLKWHHFLLGRVQAAGHRVKH